MPKERRPSIYGKEEEGGKGGAVAVIIVLVLIGGVIFAMMQDGGGPVADADNLLAQSKLSAESITKESFTFEGSIEASTEAGYFGIPLSGDGKIDSDNQRMYFKINLEAPETAAGTQGSDLKIETYAIGNMVYTNFADIWSKYEAGDRLWGNAQFTSKLLGLAENFDLSLTEKEVINGRAAYKLVVNPTMEELVEIMATMDPGILERVGATNFDNVGEGVRNIEVIIWIAEDDFLPIRSDISLSAETLALNPGGSGVIDGEIAIDFTLNFDYKTPFNIVLPSDAADAVEL
jgi:hypothetical protein